MRHTKLRKPLAEFALNSINDFKVRCFQIQTLTFIVNSDVFYYEWRPLWIEMNWLFSLVQRVRCSFACLEGGIAVACLRHALSTKYALRLHFMLTYAGQCCSNLYTCWSVSTSDTEYPNLFWSTSNLCTLSYWVWFRYCKNFCLTTSKAETSSIFPLRWATAQYHQIICAVKSDSRTLATFQNVGKARKQG